MYKLQRTLVDKILPYLGRARSKIINHGMPYVVTTSASLSPYGPQPDDRTTDGGGMTIYGMSAILGLAIAFLGCSILQWRRFDQRVYGRPQDEAMFKRKISEGGTPNRKKLESVMAGLREQLDSEITQTPPEVFDPRIDMQDWVFNPLDRNSGTYWESKRRAAVKSGEQEEFYRAVNLYRQRVGVEPLFRPLEVAASVGGDPDFARAVLGDYYPILRPVLESRKFQNALERTSH